MEENNTEIMEENNTEMVTRIMEGSRQGFVMQLFVLNSLEKQCDIVLANQDKLRKIMRGGMVDPEAWIACAQELKETFNSHYGRTRQETAAGEQPAG